MSEVFKFLLRNDRKQKSEKEERETNLQKLLTKKRGHNNVCVIV